MVGYIRGLTLYKFCVIVIISNRINNEMFIKRLIKRVKKWLDGPAQPKYLGSK